MKIDDYNHDFEKDSKRPTEIVFIKDQPKNQKTNCAVQSKTILKLFMF